MEEASSTICAQEFRKQQVKTAKNPHTYIEPIKQQSFIDFLVLISTILSEERLASPHGDQEEGLHRFCMISIPALRMTFTNM